jgi:hypothetical protein
VEPRTNYFVGRLKKDYLGGNLVVGGIATSAYRQMDTTFAARLNAHSEFYGTDFQYTWDNRSYSLVGQYALTNVAGDPRDILLRQRSSARYFQRPDRGAGSGGFLSNRLDSTATAMRGAGAYMRLSKQAGDWQWETSINARTPGFENNDIGFITRADYIWYNANVVRFWTKPTSWYRDFVVIGGGQQQRNFDGDVTDRQMHIYGGATLLNFWSTQAFFLRRPATLDDRLLRGGPVVEKQSLNFSSASISSNSRHRVIWNLNADYFTQGGGGSGTDWAVSATYRPTSALRLTFGPSWTSNHTQQQYVTTVADPTATAFYGSRYILSGLRQKQLALDTRLAITFSPTMTFELYAQPFIATGAYSDFREFTAPRQGRMAIFGQDRGTISATTNATGLVDHYTIDPDGAGPAAAFDVQNPDFNLRSVRGNAVFRWEYRPGSTLYLAWTQSRSASEAFGDFNFARDRTGLFSTRPDNIFLVKASWWLPR